VRISKVSKLIDQLIFCERWAKNRRGNEDKDKEVEAETQQEQKVTS